MCFGTSTPSTLRSCEITLLPLLGKYLHTVLHEELFVKFDAIEIRLLEVLGMVVLHRVVPMELVGVVVLEVDGDPVGMDIAEVVDDGLDLAPIGRRAGRIEFVLAECEPDPEKGEDRDERVTGEFPFRGASYAATACSRASRFRRLR
jgi:hypothetical protein